MPNFDFLRGFLNLNLLISKVPAHFYWISLAQHLLCKLSSRNLVRTFSYRILSINLISIFALLCLFSNSTQSFSLKRCD